MKLKQVCLLAALMVAPGMALAAGGQAFVRGEIGSSDLKIKDHYSVDGETGSVSDSDTDGAFAVRGGYWFTRNIGVEAVYSNSYDKDYTKVTGYGAGVVAKKNFGAGDTGWFISGRAGVLKAKVEAKDLEDLDAEGLKVDENSTKAYYGIGGGYDFSQHLGLSLNYDISKADFSARFGDSSDNTTLDVKILSLGLEYRF